MDIPPPQNCCCFMLQVRERFCPTDVLNFDPYKKFLAKLLPEEHSQKHC